MKWLFAFAFLGTSVLPSWAGTHAPDPPISEPPSAQSSASSLKKQSPRKRGRYLKGRRSARKRGPSYQLHPDPERYQEIQRALADRGYFKGEVNGKWGDDSTDALKRFQADQKLPDDGKINSLSLIGLGLGPKHNGSSVTPANGAATPAVQPPPVPDSLPPATSENSPN
ncbi:MAG: peptidoglycan-binding domain-containing protein [Bryobacteraceae bacterium]